MKFFTKFYLGDVVDHAQDLKILVYQMGKVGSITITHSLQNYNLLVYHFHTLRLENMKNRKKRQFTYWVAKYLRKEVVRNTDLKKWKIVTLVRDPVARNVSAFFQLWLHPFFIKFKVKNLKKPMSNEEISDIFLEYNRHSNWFKILNWFDNEMKKILGIDVYSVDFPKNKGYKIYKSRGYPDLMLIRLENLTECAAAAFKEFLGIEDFTLQNSNITRDMPYGRIYQRFISSKVIPRFHVEKMYASKYAQHFYTEEELNTFKKKWMP